MINNTLHSFCLLGLIPFFFGCKSIHTQNIDVVDVTVDTILHQKCSIRAMLAGGQAVWYAADKNKIGCYDTAKGVFTHRQLATEDGMLEFRAMAQNRDYIFVANIGSPAFIYRVKKSDFSYEKVYTETNEKAFYDAIFFWNEKEGIAVGDPTAGCLSVVITRDGGTKWEKTSCKDLPEIVEGEAAFAASNTNICSRGGRTWVVSGGKKARVFSSEDKGRSWIVANTPIIQGQAMTGIFTSDFYDQSNGIIAGGNYEQPLADFVNKAITTDGGANWSLVSDHSGFGYASCIQFVPGTAGKEIICVGLTGVFYSTNQGASWKKILDDKDLYTIRFSDRYTAYAAGKDKIIRLRFHK